MSTRPRIAVLSPHVGVGGAEAYLLTLLPRLSRDFDIELFIAVDPTVATFFQSIDGVRVRPVPWFPEHRALRSGLRGRLARRVHRSVPTVSRTIQAAQRMRAFRASVRRSTKLFVSSRFDGVLANNGGYPGSPIALAGLVGAAQADVARRVLLVHGEPVPRTLLGRWEAKMDAQVAAAATAIVTPSHRNADLLARVRHAPSNLVRVVPTGTEAPPPEFLAKRTEDPHHVRVGMLARAEPGKRQDLVLDAAERVWSSFPGAEFHFGGDGSNLSRLRERAQRTSRPDQIHFHGATDGLRFLAGVDISVLASDHEGVPLVVLEAMSLSVPVVASAVGGLPEVLSPGTGMLVPPGRADPISAALTELIASREAREEMGRRGFEAWASSHSAEAMGAAFEEILRPPKAPMQVEEFGGRSTA